MPDTTFHMISIHAPPRGATSTLPFFTIPLLISIHAPPRGATLSEQWRVCPSSISIHAPPRGATVTRMISMIATNISIHAPPRGATARHPHSAVHSPYFNSRPSARGDIEADHIPLRQRFQFTPLREGRRYKRRKAMSEIISIHAPPRGATKSEKNRGWALGFQFTPLREGRPENRKGQCACIPNFNSRPSARGDGKRYAISANLLFNPYKSAWLNNRATQFVEIILVIFHRIIA